MDKRRKYDDACDGIEKEGDGEREKIIARSKQTFNVYPTGFRILCNKSWTKKGGGGSL